MDKKIEARLHVLESVVSLVLAGQFRNQYGGLAPEKLIEIRQGLWDGMSQLNLNKLPQQDAKELEAEIRDAFDRLLKVVAYNLENN